MGFKKRISILPTLCNSYRPSEDIALAFFLKKNIIFLESLKLALDLKREVCRPDIGGQLLGQLSKLAFSIVQCVRCFHI